MNNQESSGFISKLDANYGSYLAKDPERVKAWKEDLQKMDFERACRAIDKFCATKEKNNIIPDLSRFKRFYFATPSDSYNSLRNASECGSCANGSRFIMMAGSHATSLKPINPKSMLCKDDSPDTVYNHYAIERIPCNCEKGVIVNLQFNPVYEKHTLDKFIQISFGKSIDAIFFMDLNVYRLKCNKAQSEDELRILWEELNKGQKEDKDYRTATNKHKLRLQELKQ